MEDEGATESAQYQVTSAQQPVIVAVSSQTHDLRKWTWGLSAGTQRTAFQTLFHLLYAFCVTAADTAKTVQAAFLSTEGNSAKEYYFG